MMQLGGVCTIFNQDEGTLLQRYRYGDEVCCDTFHKYRVRGRVDSWLLCTSQALPWSLLLCWARTPESVAKDIHRFQSPYVISRIPTVSITVAKAWVCPAPVLQGRGGVKQREREPSEDAHVHYVPSYTNTHRETHTHTHKHTHTRTKKKTHIYIHIHTYIQTDRQTYIHT